MIQRNCPLLQNLKKKSVLLLGPRRTGKSFWIRESIKPDQYYNLLEADTFRKLAAQPEFIRKNLVKKNSLVAIDEVQKLPSMMDEVHTMIEEHHVRFLLTGSSARKLGRSHTSLMAGRARRLYFHSLNSQEMGSYDLRKVLSFGTLPPVYLSDEPQLELQDYVGLYLKEEILAEALTRKIENFSRFLNFAALTNGQLLNFDQLGRDAEVPPRTIREYYQLLEDTLFGTTIYPVKSTSKRKSISKGKFYFFDLGVVSALRNRSLLNVESPEFGDAFEHFILSEIICYRDYFCSDLSIEFWQYPGVGEVDFILNGEIAVEVKAQTNLREGELKSLKNFIQASPLRKHYLVCQVSQPQTYGKIEILPYKVFLERLWAGELLR